MNGIIIQKQNRRQKKQFRVKFSNGQRQRPKKTVRIQQKKDQDKDKVGKELIIKGRSRQKIFSANINAQQEYSSKTLHIDSQTESELSKRPLEITNMASSPVKVDYGMITTSAIVNDLTAVQAFFKEEVRFKLIFRASNHAFSVRQFHQICDQYSDTMTLCLTEDNKIVGGYTPLTWEEQYEKNSTYFKTDFKRQTFLFSVSDNCKYPLAKSLKNKAICCFKSYGPTFGGGYDLLIGDKSNQLPNTSSYFPRNFQHPKGVNYNKRQFTGTSRKSFKLQEWQVFKVIKLNPLMTVQNMNIEDYPNERFQRDKSLFEKFKIAAKDIFTYLCSDN